MTSYIFPYEDYYKQQFVDPLFYPYTRPRKLYLNPDTMNANEVRYNWGQTFRKKYSGYPCPMGFKNIDGDYCKRFIPQIPLFYTTLGQNFLNDEFPRRDFTNFSTEVPSVYPM
jgi:hypothetical protein